MSRSISHVTFQQSGDQWHGKTRCVNQLGHSESMPDSVDRGGWSWGRKFGLRIDTSWFIILHPGQAQIQYEYMNNYTHFSVGESRDLQLCRHHLRRSGGLRGEMILEVLDYIIQYRAQQSLCGRMEKITVILNMHCLKMWGRSRWEVSHDPSRKWRQCLRKPITWANICSKVMKFSLQIFANLSPCKSQWWDPVRFLFLIFRIRAANAAALGSLQLSSSHPSDWDVSNANDKDYVWSDQQ